MLNRTLNWLISNFRAVITVVVLLVIGAGAAVTYPRWLPPTQQLVASLQPKGANDQPDDQLDDSAMTGQADQIASLELSPVAWKNIGLTTGVVAPSDFTKTVSVPAMVVERPGRSQIDITAHMNGVVTRIYGLEGEAIQPGQPLFDLHLTHEDIVTSQSEFLMTIQELDVINRELERLSNVGEGVILGRRIVEQQYARDKALAKLRALRQALLLHGLSESQVQEIEDKREVIKSVTITAPPFAQESDHLTDRHLYHVQSTDANRGQNVPAGELLGTLGDHCWLYVEGQAFEEDAAQLVEAARTGQKLKVKSLAKTGAPSETIELPVLYVADHVDQQSRALKFYLSLPNKLLRDESTAEHRFIAWKYRPGQRLEVQVPTAAPLSQQIVLPSESVVIEGPNAYVFEQNGEHFDRIDVHVLYRDRNSVVIENDGKLVGSTIALTGAYQMNLALKTQQGGGAVDHAHPHPH